MNDPRKPSRPMWPGEDPDADAQDAGESTGFYRPAWDDDPPANGNGHRNGNGNGNGRGGSHRVTEDGGAPPWARQPYHPPQSRAQQSQPGQPSPPSVQNRRPPPQGQRPGPPQGQPRQPGPPSGLRPGSTPGSAPGAAPGERPGQPGRPGEPSQFRQPAAPNQNSRPSQPARPGAPGTTSQPGRNGLPARPGQPQPGQPTSGQPQPGQAQPSQPRSEQSRRAPATAPQQGDGETEMIPLVDEDDDYGNLRREPELLTHREDDPDDGPLAADYDHRAYDSRDGGDLDYDDEDDYDDDDDREPPRRVSSLDSARRRRKRRWRRIRRTIYVVAAVCILGPIVAFFVAYQVLSVPSPEEAQAQLAQPVNYYFANNALITTDKTDGGNRTVLKANQIPDTVKHAVYAAEDATFESNAGFDLGGIGRAVWNQVTGGSGGGSTITQQYIKQATGNDQHSYLRKATEVVKAYKMNNEQSKADIITAYLNTIYFGRNAYGIQAAAKAYFNTDVAHLTKPQAALLAGMIQGPGRSENADYRTQRCNYVMDQMVHNKWMTPQERAEAQVPQPIRLGSNSVETQLQKEPYLTHVKEQVNEELQNAGLDPEALHRAGAKIYTTLDPKVQQMAVDANDKIMDSDKKDPHLVSGQVSVNPSNGNILAYYPGQWEKTQFDEASGAHQPGSSFKPFTFLALLENKPGAGLGSTFDGTPNQVIKGVKVGNADEESCGTACSVKTAMTESVNTVFYNIAAEIGTQKVRDAAWQAGIPRSSDQGNCKNMPTLTQIDLRSCIPEEVGGGIALGQYPVSPKDMAQAYATFVNKGQFIPAHFVTKVTDSSGENTLYQAQTQGKPAFDPGNPGRNAQLARNVVESMTDVASFSKTPLSGGRENAAKTGTAQAFANGDEDGNSAAWMVGGTPQVVTSVYVGDSREEGKSIHGNYRNPKGSSHHYDIYGREEPAFIWQDFTDNYLEDKPYEDFGPFTPMGDQPEATSTTSTTTSETTTKTTTSSETTREQTPTTKPTTGSTTKPGGGDKPTGEPPKPGGGGGGHHGGGGGGGHGGGGGGGGPAREPDEG